MLLSLPQSFTLTRTATQIRPLLSARPLPVLRAAEVQPLAIPAKVPERNLLNANRDRPMEPTTAPAPALIAEPPAPAAIVKEAPQGFDWRKWLPWIIAAVLLLLLVVFASRRRAPAGG